MLEELEQKYENDPSLNFELRKKLKDQTDTNTQFDDAKAKEDEKAK